MADLSRSDFARGVNEAIRALRAVYAGVRTMLDELKDALQDGSAPLYDLGVRARPSAGRTNPDEKILRTWEGRFYAAEADVEESDDDDSRDDDDEDERADRKCVSLSDGQCLAFAKVVLYHHGEVEGEPHVLYGVLRDCRVDAGWPVLAIPRSRLRRVLDVVRSDIRLGKLETRASVQLPPDTQRGRGTSKANRLICNIDRSPQSFPLFDLRGRDQVRQIAALLKDHWTAADNSEATRSGAPTLP